MTEIRGTSPSLAASATHDVASKVPRVTVAFWIVKILTTGMGEAASDALAKAGGLVAVAATGLAFLASLVAQFRVSRYHPGVYWLAVVMVSVFGTMAADVPHFLGIPVWATSSAYLLAVVVIFALWHRSEGTLEFGSINSRRRESYYWAAVLATFALGTAVGDLTAFSWGWGALTAGIVFAALFCPPGAARRWLGLNGVAAFWSAYVLTRPFGASPTGWAAPPATEAWAGACRWWRCCGRSSSCFSLLTSGSPAEAAAAVRPGTSSRPRTAW
jgi:uncharacterized membrane-anchored protein